MECRKMEFGYLIARYERLGVMAAWFRSEEYRDSISICFGVDLETDREMLLPLLVPIGSDLVASYADSVADALDAAREQTRLAIAEQLTDFLRPASPPVPTASPAGSDPSSVDYRDDVPAAHAATDVDADPPHAAEAGAA